MLARGPDVPQLGIVGQAGFVRSVGHTCTHGPGECAKSAGKSAVTLGVHGDGRAAKVLIPPTLSIARSAGKRFMRDLVCTVKVTSTSPAMIATVIQFAEFVVKNMMYTSAI